MGLHSLELYPSNSCVLLLTHSFSSLGRAEATDVANAVLDGADGVLLGAETLRGKYPTITVKTVLAICRQAEEVFDYSGHFECLTLQGEEVSLKPASNTLACLVSVGPFVMLPQYNRMSWIMSQHGTSIFANHA